MRAATLPLFLTTLPILILSSRPTLAGDVEVELPAGDGFVVKDNTGAIERLRIDEATGNVSRNGALFVHTTGTNNIFVGEGTGNTGTSGNGRNSAFGNNALTSVTTGHRNSAFGDDALRFNTGGLRNSAFGHYTLRMNTVGAFNSAFGTNALRYNTSIGNSAFGHDALRSNTTGGSNSAFGYFTLVANTTGSSNAAFGSRALHANTMGARNSAFGHSALERNTTGYRNAAFGHGALDSNTTGSRSVAIGNYAGGSQTTGNDNIYLANAGVAGESGQIKIGTAGTHTNTHLVGDVTTPLRLAVGTNTIDPAREFTLNDQDDNGGASMKITTTNPAARELVIGVNQGSGSFISMNSSAPLDFRTNGTRRLRIQADGTIDSAGIAGNTSPGVSVVNVLLNTTTNELGIVVSSARFKQDVADMGAASEALMALRPVSFRYREDVAAGEDGSQYGLIAEEVAEVAPELVVYDGEGLPYSVRYHQLAPLLLNEVQKQEQRDGEHLRRIEEQQLTIERQQRAIERQQRAIEILLARTEQLDTAGPHGLRR